MSEPNEMKEDLLLLEKEMKKLERAPSTPGKIKKLAIATRAKTMATEYLKIFPEDVPTGRGHGNTK